MGRPKKLSLHQNAHQNTEASEKAEKTELEKNIEKESVQITEKVSKTQKHKPESDQANQPASKKIVLFVEIKPENYFVLCDGRVIKDYRELAVLLETISDDIFSYHVNVEKNDFANWINDIFKEEELAANLRAAKDKTEMIALLYKNLFEKLERMMNT